MTLYTAKGCPQCRFLRQKLDEKGIVYEICEDPASMPDLRSIPALQTDDGRILSMREALKLVNETEPDGMETCSACQESGASGL